LSWQNIAREIPWKNTVYDVAFDPKISGKIWAACSNQHDIPMWSNIQGPTHTGGVVVSTDGGDSWKRASTGLPKAPVTALAIDTHSKPQTRRLYAAVYGHGIFRSDNAGTTWRTANQGILPVANRQVVALQLHQDGTLFCSVAARRKGRDIEHNLTGGLFRSINQGKDWQKISSAAMFRTVDFIVADEDSQTITVAAMDGMGQSGGVYITHDAGLHWRHSLPKFDRDRLSYIEGFSIARSSTQPQRLYFTSLTHGMFVSQDDGNSWQPLDADHSPPFMSCLRITPDPDDAKRVFITTFGGGAWHGRLE